MANKIYHCTLEIPELKGNLTFYVTDKNLLDLHNAIYKRNNFVATAVINDIVRLVSIDFASLQAVNLTYFEQKPPF